jgi:hypothetical protein
VPIFVTGQREPYDEDGSKDIRPVADKPSGEGIEAGLFAWRGVPLKTGVVEEKAGAKTIFAWTTAITCKNMSVHARHP